MDIQKEIEKIKEITEINKKTSDSLAILKKSLEERTATLNAIAERLEKREKDLEDREKLLAFRDKEVSGKIKTLQELRKKGG